MIGSFDVVLCPPGRWQLDSEAFAILVAANQPRVNPSPPCPTGELVTSHASRYSREELDARSVESCDLAY